MFSNFKFLYLFSVVFSNTYIIKTTPWFLFLQLEKKHSYKNNFFRRFNSTTGDEQQGFQRGPPNFFNSLLTILVWTTFSCTAATIIDPFDCNVPSLGSRWAEWSKRLQHLFIASQITNDQQKLSALFLLGGPELNSIHNMQSPAIASREFRSRYWLQVSYVQTQDVF